LCRVNWEMHGNQWEGPSGGVDIVNIALRGLRQEKMSGGEGRLRNRLYAKMADSRGGKRNRERSCEDANQRLISDTNEKKGQQKEKP